MQREPRDPALIIDMTGFCREAISYLRGVAFERYSANKEKQRAIERVLELTGEAASQLTEAFRVAHPEIAWRDIVGLRHVLIHGYGGIDQQRIWQAATRDVPVLLEALTALDR